MTIKDAAWLVMKKAYLAASAGGTLPANKRQIMYAARPLVLELTGGKIWSDDKYFIQNLLNAYLENYPSETADWDVVADARGTLVEPHTGREVPLGTIEVREYICKIGAREARDDDDALAFPKIPADVLYPTVGPEKRFQAALFVEKEGFDQLIKAARLCERYDLAKFSTKGMSVGAARQLVDALAERGGSKFWCCMTLMCQGFQSLARLAPIAPSTSSRTRWIRSTLGCVLQTWKSWASRVSLSVRKLDRRIARTHSGDMALLMMRSSFWWSAASSSTS
jgi:hypothetical protein